METSHFVFKIKIINETGSKTQNSVDAFSFVKVVEMLRTRRHRN